VSPSDTLPEDITNTGTDHGSQQDANPADFLTKENPVRSSLAILILFLCLALPQAHAVKISVLNCEACNVQSVAPLVAEPEYVQFPSD